MSASANAANDIYSIRCERCGAVMTAGDFGELGLRAPDHGETRWDYFDSQLLDALSHLSCGGAA